MHYTILARLGAGGMGEVYLAHDGRLDRRVALKLLPPEMASDPERLDRLAREARALAALDHANIVTVFSVEEAEGLHFLTMALRRRTNPRHPHSTRRYVSPYEQARILVALNEVGAAFERLERAVEDQSFGVAFLAVEPDFDPLRSDPRFEDLLRRIGLSS